MSVTAEYASEIHRLLKLGDAPLIIPGASEELPTLPVLEPAIEHAEVKNTHTDQHEVLEITEEKRFSLKSLWVYPVVFLVAFMF